MASKIKFQQIIAYDLIIIFQLKETGQFCIMKTLHTMTLTRLMSKRPEPAILFCDFLTRLMMMALNVSVTMHIICNIMSKNECQRMVH